MLLALIKRRGFLTSARAFVNADFLLGSEVFSFIATLLTKESALMSGSFLRTRKELRLGVGAEPCRLTVLKWWLTPCESRLRVEKLFRQGGSFIFSTEREESLVLAWYCSASVSLWS